MKDLHKLLLIVNVLSLQLNADILPGERDPWLWPFDRYSIWNMPIGSDAQYRAAGFEAAGHAGVDIQHILQLDNQDPQRQAYQTTSFGPGRCSGTEVLDISLPLPDTWIVPDAGNSPYGDSPNSNFAFLLPGSDTVFEGSLVSRCTEGGPFYLPDFMKWPDNQNYQDIRGNGLEGGGQGASGMSALGGTIRRGELINDTPIRHALKINPWAEKYCHYSEAVPGFTWPATSADNYAPQQYNPQADPDIVMGALFAILPTVTPESLDIVTIPGKKLFFTLQNYGAYFTEDAAWDTWDLIVERGAEKEFEDTYGFSMSGTTWQNDLNKLIQALHVVTNNTPQSIGGGGTPRQPLAPDFASSPTTSSIPSPHVGKREITLPHRSDAVRYFSISGREIHEPGNQTNSRSLVYISRSHRDTKLLFLNHKAHSIGQ